VPNYTYRGTDTVKNAFGTADHAELERIEAALVKARHAEIDAGFGPAGQFDAEHIKAIHQHLFQDVYEWAGHTDPGDRGYSSPNQKMESVIKLNAY